LTELLRIKNLIKKIKNKSKTLSGGSGEKVRYIMYEPDLYWDLGVVIEELCNTENIPENERFSWIDENLRSVEDEIWSGHQLIKESYKIKYELIDKEQFDKVKKIAGHKFKQFRLRRCRYLLSSFSKRKPLATPEQQEQLIKKLSEKNYTHDDFLEEQQKILGVLKIPINEIGENYDKIFELLKNAIEGDEKQRDELRKEIGIKHFEPFRWLLQLTKETNPQKFNRMYNRKVRSVIQQDFRTKYPFLNSFYKQLRSCLGDFEKIALLHNVIQQGEMSSINSKLKALQSEPNFLEYDQRKEALKYIFKEEPDKPSL